MNQNLSIMKILHFLPYGEITYYGFLAKFSKQAIYQDFKILTHAGLEEDAQIYYHDFKHKISWDQ